MGTILKWGNENPTLVALIVLVISLLQNQLGRLIRGALTLSGRGMKRTALSFYQGRLDLLEWLHDNTFGLALWALRSILDLAFELVILSITVVVGIVGMAYLLGNTPDVRLIYILLPGMIVGQVIGEIIKMRETIKGLYEYKATTANFKTSIAALEQKLSCGDSMRGN